MKYCTAPFLARHNSDVLARLFRQRAGILCGKPEVSVYSGLKSHLGNSLAIFQPIGLERPKRDMQVLYPRCFDVKGNARRSLRYIAQASLGNEVGL